MVRENIAKMNIDEGELPHQGSFIFICSRWGEYLIDYCEEEYGIPLSGMSLYSSGRKAMVMQKTMSDRYLFEIITISKGKNLSFFIIVMAWRMHKFEPKSSIKSCTYKLKILAFFFGSFLSYFE